MSDPSPCHDAADPAPAIARDEVRALDRIAIERYGIPGVVLMENAGRACAEEAAEMLGLVEGRAVAVLCGKGNNGGDGFVIARHLANGGADVEIILLAKAEDVLAAETDAAVNLRVVRNMGLTVVEAVTPDGVRAAVREMADRDLTVDALLGTGARGEVREPFLAAIEALNALDCPVLAVDLPSGLDCDTGKPLGVAVRADRTVTFVLAKRGFAAEGADAYTGEVRVADIGIPRAEIDRLRPRKERQPPRRARRTRRTAFDDLSNVVIGCAIEVHRQLGPGLMESAYAKCLAQELGAASVTYEMETVVPIVYKGVTIDSGFRTDLIFGRDLIVEIKSVARILSVHEAQILTYMRLAGCPVGLLLNFNVPRLKEGITRFVL